MVDELHDERRPEPPLVAPEREMLETWLEYQRVTLLLTGDGHDDAARKRRPVTTSMLSLHGLVRHMAEVERNWFTRTLQRLPETPHLWYDTAIEDSELVPLDDAVWEDDLAAWLGECESARTAAAKHALDDTGLRRGVEHSLRWIYVHMIEEYARHNGHADLIRELIDGSVGL